MFIISNIREYLDKRRSVWTERQRILHERLARETGLGVQRVAAVRDQFAEKGVYAERSLSDDGKMQMHQYSGGPLSRDRLEYGQPANPEVYPLPRALFTVFGQAMKNMDVALKEQLPDYNGRAGDLSSEIFEARTQLEGFLYRSKPIQAGDVTVEEWWAKAIRDVPPETTRSWTKSVNQSVAFAAQHIKDPAVMHKLGFGAQVLNCQILGRIPIVSKRQIDEVAGKVSEGLEVGKVLFPWMEWVTKLGKLIKLTGNKPHVTSERHPQ